MFRIKNPFKKEENRSKAISDIPSNIAKSERSMEQTAVLQQEKVEESRAPEIEVLIAKIEALKFQYEALSEKVGNIEKMVREIYEMAKASS